MSNIRSSDVTWKQLGCYSIKGRNQSETNQNFHTYKERVLAGFKKKKRGVDKVCNQTRLPIPALSHTSSLLSTTLQKQETFFRDVKKR